jgi:hypothetical protein
MGRATRGSLVSALSREMLEARIDREREELADALEDARRGARLAVEDVRARARAELDVASRVRARPMAWLVGASLVGLWLGARR